MCRAWYECHGKDWEALSGDLPSRGREAILKSISVLTSTDRLQPLALQRKPRAEKFYPIEECWGVSLWRVLGSGSVMRVCYEQRKACVFKSPYVVLGINTKYTEGLFF